MARKNSDLDLKVARRFATFMKARGFTDGRLGKLIGAAAPTGATWRHGTRPYPHWRPALNQLTGWDWDDPASIAALTDDMIRSAVDGEPVPDIPTEALASGSFAAIIIARDGIKAACDEGRALDPARPADAMVLTMAAEALSAEVDRRISTEADFKEASDIRKLVIGHTDPARLLDFLASNVDARIMAEVRQSLARTTSALSI